jgi:CheY-like chemotaxis protein
MVEAAESGAAGLAILQQQPVDLVLADLTMPGLSGWDVARLTKAMHPHLPVVLVTGWTHTMSPDQPERQVVDAILAKPFGMAAIQAVIGPLTRDLADAACSRS